MTIITRVSQLDTDNRTTLCELIQCDPFAGYLAREYLDFQAIRGATLECGTLELIAWLILARETCGIEGVGHA